MSQIFVSYASEDRDRVMPVVRALEATGWSVFWDRTIPVGETWQKVIGAEIEACRCMVVIWSATSINKEWVYEEASEGKRRGVLAPVLIDDIIPPIGFRSIQAARLWGWDGKGASAELDRMINDISHMLGTPPLKIEEQKQQADLEAKKQKEKRKAQRKAEAQKARAEATVPKETIDPTQIQGASQIPAYDVSPLVVDEIRLRALIRQAELGSANAMEELGYAYDTGKGVPKDRGKAFHWHLRAAEAGNVTGMFNVANIYSIEKPYKDEQKAFSWFRKAAEAGDRYGMMRLAHAYEHGLRIERDYGQAIVWYRKACEREVPGAEDDLERAILLEQESKRSARQP